MRPSPGRATTKDVRRTRKAPRAFAEADRGGWFNRAEAMKKITKGQRPILDKFFAEIRP
jgi:predicted NUDIX family NTP pyrophosphohydrolase